MEDITIYELLNRELKILRSANQNYMIIDHILQFTPDKLLNVYCSGDVDTG
jgi:hypothetical protein